MQFDQATGQQGLGHHASIPQRPRSRVVSGVIRQVLLSRQPGRARRTTNSAKIPSNQQNLLI
jgi:hypothetical protein